MRPQLERGLVALAYTRLPVLTPHDFLLASPCHVAAASAAIRIVSLCARCLCQEEGGGGGAGHSSGTWLVGWLVGELAIGISCFRRTTFPWH